MCTNLYTVITNSNHLRAWAWIIIFVSLILFICRIFALKCHRTVYSISDSNSKKRYEAQFKPSSPNHNHNHRLYITGWALASSVCVFFFRFHNFFLCGEVVSLMPNPQPEGPGYPCLSWSSPLTCLAQEALPVAYATTSIALRII